MWKLGLRPRNSFFSALLSALERPGNLENLFFFLNFLFFLLDSPQGDDSSHAGQTPVKLIEESLTKLNERSSLHEEKPLYIAHKSH